VSGDENIAAFLGSIRNLQREPLPEVIASIGALGAAGRPAIDWLLSFRAQERLAIREAVGHALGGIGLPARPAIDELLGDPDWRVREVALVALGDIGSAARSAAPRVLQDIGNQNLRWRVLPTLVLVANPPIDALVQVHALHGRTPSEIEVDWPPLADHSLVIPGPDRAPVRDEKTWRDAGALVARGPEASADIEATFREPHDATTRLAVAGQILVHAEHAGFAAPALVEAARDPDARVRDVSIVALGKLGADATVALVAALDDPRLRPGALRALGRIGGTSAFVPALVAALRSDDDALRAVAVDVVQTSTSSDAAISTLIAALRDRDPQIRRPSARAIALIGRRAVNALPEISRLVDDPVVGDWARQAILAIRFDPNRLDAIRRTMWVLGW
jgi:HEAT repeat protein